MKGGREMRLIAKIKEMIYKVKDYDRLESDYCTVLDMLTGARLSKPNYTMNGVREAFHEFLDERDKLHKDAFVERACKWFNQHYRDYIHNPTGNKLEAFFGMDMVEDFKKYMEE